MKIIYFLQNHSINLPEIWSDCSIYVFLWLVSVVLLAIWSANNYKRSIKDEYDQKSYFNMDSLNHKVDSLESENSYLKQAFKSYKEDMQVEISRLKQLERKRNNKGQFVSTSGKGHGKKKEVEIDWTKATKEELLSEAKRRYPTGTKIKTTMGNVYTVKNIINEPLYNFTNINGIKYNLQIICKIEESITKTISLYFDGVWAKIIKS